MKFVTSKEIRWVRTFSAFRDPIVFPAGTPVDIKNRTVNGKSVPAEAWISHTASDLQIIQDDLIVHGCQVPLDDVTPDPRSV